jgi:hypothetical protein
MSMFKNNYDVLGVVSSHLQSGGRGWEDCSSRPALSKSFLDLLSTNKKLNVVGHVCHPSYMGNINSYIFLGTGV